MFSNVTLKDPDKVHLSIGKKRFCGQSWIKLLLGVVDKIIYFRFSCVCLLVIRVEACPSDL